jgi:acyl-CoA thioester hydrolase
MLEEEHMNFGPTVWSTRVRVYECDALGHVNNAVYLHYMQQATAAGWGTVAPVSWELRRLAMEYVAPAFSGDELAVSAWPEGGEDGLMACGYAIRRSGDGQMLARARAAWAWLHRETHEFQSLPEGWPVSTPENAASLNPLRVSPDSLGARSYRWAHTVRYYEADGMGRVNPAEILHWLQEAKYMACAEAGWPLERIRNAGCVIVQIRHDTEFLDALVPGDDVEIVSRVYEVRRVRGTWRQEIYRGGRLVATEYSAGAFLNLALRPSPPPAAMLDALIGGKGWAQAQ